MTETGPAAALARAEIRLAIGGMTCAACARRVERRLSALPDVAASVNFATDRALVLAPISLPVADLIAAVERAGYSAAEAGWGPEPGDGAGPDAPAGERDDALAQRQRYLRRRLMLAAAFFIPLSDISAALSLFPAMRFPGWQWVLVALAAPVVLWAAWPFHRAAVRGLRHGALTMDTLVSLGITAATAWSVYAMFVLDARGGSRSPRYELTHAAGGGIYLEVAAAVATFLLAGRYVEARGRHSATQAMRDLAGSAARQVLLVDDLGGARSVPVAELRAGQTFMIRPGETIAADGEVVFGHSEIDASMLTGESVPAEAGPGGMVSAGTTVMAGRLIVRATRVGPETRVARLVRLVEEGQAQKAAVQRLADRISAVFVPAVLLMAAATLAGWLAAGAGPTRAFGAGLAVLIIACPCALGLATPAALAVASGRGARLGIFIKGYPALESSQRTGTVVLDKTGTLTTGVMSVCGVALVPGVRRADFLRRAGAVEQASEHSVAAAVAALALAEAGPLPPAADFTALPGLGATGQADGTVITVGRARLLRDRGLAIPAVLAAVTAEWEAAGRTVMVAGWDGQARGAIAVADAIRPSAAAAIAELRRLGLHTILLTGDNQATAGAVGAQAGVDEVRAGVLPDGKAAVIRALRADGQHVAMVGDGINDAPALAAADLALAFGSGTDVAMSAADVIILRDDLLAVPEAIRLTRATYRVIRRNLAWAFGYNLAAIPLAAAGWLNPIIAAAAMTLSSTFVVWNSLRLRTAPVAVPVAGHDEASVPRRHEAEVTAPGPG